MAFSCPAAAPYRRPGAQYGTYGRSRETLMPSLGSFGAALREYDPASAEPTTFEFCGETFTVHSAIPAILELTLEASLSGKISALDGDVALHESLRHALTVPKHERGGVTVPADGSQWRKFVQLAADNAAPSDVLTEICFKILGWQIGRPTERQSGSDAGLSPTSTNSNSSATSAESPQDPVSAG